MLLTTPAIFSATGSEDILQITEQGCAEASTTGIAADSPKSDISLVDPIDLVISTTTTLASMLPHLAESSKKQIEDVITVLHGSGHQKFKDAETMLRACEITPDEAQVEREDSPVSIGSANEVKSLRELDRDVLQVIRSLGLYLRESLTDEGYHADSENNGSSSAGDSPSSL